MSSEKQIETVKSTDPQEKGKGRSNKKQSVNSVKLTKFEGRCDDLKGHIYDYGDSKNADQFVLTTKEIKNYVGRTYKCAGDITAAITALRIPALTEPAAPADPDDRVAFKKWDRAYDEYRKTQKTLDDNVKSLYSLVWGQCSESMQQKVESLDTFTAIETANDGIALLVAIKNMSYDYQSQKYRIESITDALYKLMTLRQNQLSTQQYYESFTNLLAVYIHCGGATAPDPGCMEYEANRLGIAVADLTAAQKTAIREMTWANWFINHSDKNRFDSLVVALHNDYLNGSDNYPKTMNAAYTRLVNYKDPLGNLRAAQSSAGVSFTTDGSDTKPKKGKKNKDHITCHKCKQKGHYANECQNEAVESVNATNGTTATETDAEESTAVGESNVESPLGFALTAISRPIPSTWILLDNQSTIDVFSNKNLLSDIHTCDRIMNIHCNAGTQQTSEMGTLAGYGEVWYHPNGIANIISLSRARDNGFIVSYDNKGNFFTLTHTDGSNQQHKFTQSERGLYFLDTAGVDGFTLITTVAETKSKFSNRDYLRAVAARKLLCKIGRPSFQTFLRIIDRNQLPNCPITRRDAINAQTIFGPDLGSLKGKTVRRSGVPAQPILNDLPLDLMSNYRDVTLVCDIMFVNKNMFFVTRSRHIQFGTVEHINNRQPATILSALKKVHAIYRQRGFVISNVLVDHEFEPLRGDLSTLGIQLNTASADEHVADIERYNRTLKERVRCIWTTLPFTKMPDRLVIEMVYTSKLNYLIDRCR